MLRPFFLTFLILLALPLAAQDGESFRFGDDAYLAGRSVAHSGAPVDDLFAAADRVGVTAPVTGSAHLAGRNVTVSGGIGENLYAAGRNVTLSGPVAGDAVLIGQDVTISGDIGGDLRVAGEYVELSGSVADTALLGGENLVVNAVIAGDLGLAGEHVEFGPDASVAGNLHVYADDPAAVVIPESVAPAERVVFHETREWQGAMSGHGPGYQGPSFWSQLRGFVAGVLAVTVLTSILAAVAPKFVAGLRERALAAPVRSGWFGFLALSAAIGSLVLFAMTGIGLLLVPVSVIGSLVLGLAGYLIGTYVLGVAVLGLLGRDLPDSLGERVLVALAGATVAALVALVPFVGWLFALLLALVGLGALMIRWFAPGFYVFAE